MQEQRPRSLYTPRRYTPGAPVVDTKGIHGSRAWRMFGRFCARRPDRMARNWSRRACSCRARREVPACPSRYGVPHGKQHGWVGGGGRGMVERSIGDVGGGGGGSRAVVDGGGGGVGRVMGGRSGGDMGGVGRSTVRERGVRPRRRRRSRRAWRPCANAATAAPASDPASPNAARTEGSESEEEHVRYEDGRRGDMAAGPMQRRTRRLTRSWEVRGARGRQGKSIMHRRPTRVGSR